MITIKCDKCGKEYKTYEAWAKKRKNHYCSKECKNKHHSELYGSGLTKKEYQAKYAQEHKEHRNAMNRARYKSLFSKEEKSAYDTEYRKKNREKLIGKSKEKYLKTRHSKKNILSAARTRAKKQGVPFDLQMEDIEIPEICPVLGIEIKFAYGKANDNSPSLDKIIPSKGYIKGNVAIMSARANWIKRDASIDEIEKLLYWMKNVIK